MDGKDSVYVQDGLSWMPIEWKIEEQYKKIKKIKMKFQ